MSSNSLHDMLRNMSAIGNFFRADVTRGGNKLGLIYVLNQTKLDFCGETFFPTYYLNWTYESTSQPQDFEVLLNGLCLPNCPLEDLAHVPQRYQYFVQENAKNLRNTSPNILRTKGLSAAILQVLKQSQPKCIEGEQQRFSYLHIDPSSPNYNPSKQGGNNPDPHMSF